MQADIALTTL